MEAGWGGSVGAPVAGLPLIERQARLEILWLKESPLIVRKLGSIYPEISSSSLFTIPEFAYVSYSR
jgi:hypothetical protein